MPILVFLGGLFASLASFFTAWVTKKIALVAAVVTVSAALWAAFALVIWGLFQGLTLITPSWMAQGLGMFVPDNATVCFSALMTAKLARAAYDYQRENLRLASFVS